MSGELIKGATIVEVASNGTKGKNFGVRIEGGTGACAGKIWIFFLEAQAPSIATYNQSFSLALTALSTGMTVRLHHYTEESCVNADFISLSK